MSASDDVVSEARRLLDYWERLQDASDDVGPRELMGDPWPRLVAGLLARIEELEARRARVMAAWDANESPEWTANVIQALRESMYEPGRWRQLLDYEASL